jgi:hypothetical protein
MDMKNEATKSSAITSISAEGGKVTIESDVCRWGLLSLPEKAPYRNGCGDEVWEVATIAEMKVGPAYKRPATLKLSAAEVLDVYTALGR